MNGAGWTDAEKHAVLGGVLTTCATTVAAFGDGFFLSAELPGVSPGCRPRRFDQSARHPLPGLGRQQEPLGHLAKPGKARRAVRQRRGPVRLNALLNDQISARQFLDLNQNVGGIDDGGKRDLDRRVADPAAKTAYEMGQLNEGSAGYASTPAIDNRQYWIETVPNGHQIIHALSMQQRLEEPTGAPVPHFIWTSLYGLGTATEMTTRPCRTT